MKIFSALLAFCAGNSPVTGEFPAQRPVTRSFDVSFDLRLDQRYVTKSPFVNVSIKDFFILQKDMFGSLNHSYLTGVAAVDTCQIWPW